MEHKCLPNIRDKCPDCEGPECTYMEGSECEALNLAYLAPDIRQELKAYRDTGLEPEEILTAKGMAEVACALNLLKEYQSVGSIERFREFDQAENDGRLVMLPCEIGDTVYVTYGDGYKLCVVDRMHIIANSQVQVRMRHFCTETLWLSALEFGKTVFLTREEAEAALKKREEADNEHLR